MALHKTINATDTAFQIVHDGATMLDGNARLNLATFVTAASKMEPQARRAMMNECATRRT